MKLVSFRRDGVPTFGCVEDQAFLDFGALLGPHVTLRDTLPAGLALWRALASAVPTADRLPFRAEDLLPPIPNPRKFLGLGGNYASHAAEAESAGIKRAETQTWFNKQTSCVNGPYDPIHLPRVSDMLDYEGELGVVIGRPGRHVTGEAAWDLVAGYVVCNDVSVRDWQMRAPTHMLGKSFDTHGPFGPWIVTTDEIADPHALELVTRVNGEIRQKASTADMTHKIPAMIEELTTAFTLEPGDILSTGSPAGVGGLMNPPRYLRENDVVRVEISRIGAIENRFVAEP